ncbi:MAG TPA: sugar transferase [Solirubrobacteraceae bacterium]|nr:sugar transferase [Solirubrobacteraceae bacterium]
MDPHLASSTTEHSPETHARAAAHREQPRTGWFYRDAPRHLARDALRRRMLACADAGAVLGGAFVAEMGPLSVAEAFWAIALLPVWLLLAKLHGLYDRDHRALRHLTVDELGSILTWSTVSTAVGMGLLAVTPAGAPDSAGVIRLWLAVTVMAALLRGLARVLWRVWTEPARAVLVGSGPLEQATRRKLELFGDMHLAVAGQLDADDLAGASPEAAEARVRDACGGAPPARVIVCTQDVNETLLADVMRLCRANRIKLSVVPPLRGMFGTAVRLTHVAELPLVEYHTWDTSVSTMTLKRCFDVAIASIALLLTAPVSILVAIAIRLDSRGPVFFRQERAGLHGEPFRMIKFRTMVCDAHDRLHDVIRMDALADPMFKLRDDPRITRVGRFLRRWSLDELPQLINVLRGDMSLVGPRPEELRMVERYRPEHRFRLEATPGMTGPMQVFGRGDLNFDERLAIEREYIENLSLGRDLRILLLTLPTVLSGRGAF